MSTNPKDIQELKTFLQTLSHGLRDPLTSIQGYADAVLFRTDAQKDREIQEYAKAIISNSRKMLEIIDQIKLHRERLE